MESSTKLPRRILFASAGLTIGGGIANLASSTLDALDQFVFEGQIDRVDVVVLHGDAPPDRSRQMGDVSLAESSNSRFAAMYARRGRARDIDLTIFDMAGVARSARLVPSRIRSPFLVFAHGDEFNPPVRRELTWPIAHASKVLTVSKTTERRLTRVKVPHGLPPVEIVAPCVARTRIEAWSHLQTGPNNEPDPTVLSVGRLDARQSGKGHDTLIQALPLVLDRMPKARLVIVGDGDNRAVLQQLARGAGVTANVTFTGFVTDEELGQLYQSASVFAMPSRQEGFGIVYAEAMWHGLPCVGSTADAAIDVIDDGETGVLVPYGDVPATAEALIGILDNAKYAKTLGENGRRVCLDRYTPEAFRNRLRSSLESIG